MIVFGSRYGSVREYAVRIASACEQQGDASEAVCRTYDLGRDRAGARSALVGSAAEPVLVLAPIYAGRLYGAVRRFLDEQRPQLETRPVALALACLYEGEEAEKQLMEAYPAWLVAHASLRAVIGGRIRVAELNPLVRAFFRSALKVSHDIDRIDDRWVSEFAAWLRHAAPPA